LLITIILIIINVLVYILVSVGFINIYDYALTPFTINYRIITSLFIHFNILHLTLNMLGLFMFGKIIERQIGSLKFLIIYMLSGIVGNLFLVVSPIFEYAGGASGAIYGLWGAFIVITQRYEEFYYVAMSLVISLFLPFIAWQAHLGGFLAGYLITLSRADAK